MALNSNELKTLQEELESTNATWVAGPTTINKLTDEQRRLRLGCIPEAETESETDEPEEKQDYSFPQESDLTNMAGANYVNPVGDQGNCNACVGFAVTATLETTLRLKTKLPYNDRSGYALPVLSPADVYFCGCGGTCEFGTYITTALRYCESTGVITWSNFPFDDGNKSCIPHTNESALRTKSTSHTYMVAVDRMKEWLSSKGALITSFDVYEDFFSYSSGVYRPSSSKLAGYHSVAVVGYSEKLQAWKCKNSWGTGWGEDGYFWIAYNVCKINDRMYGVGGFASYYSYPILTFGGSKEHDRGASPAVALSKTASVEVHQSHRELALWYRSGNTSGSWNDSHKYDQGWGPTVALNDNGLAVEVHKSQTASTLWYHIGRLKGKEVEWKGSIKYDNGLHPGIAINNNNYAVEVHQAPGATRLYYRVGIVGENTIAWGDSHEYEGSGIHPRIAINNNNHVVEIHQSNTTATFWCSLGNLNDDKTITWRESHKCDKGYYPGIALDDLGRVIAVHQSEAKIGLWYQTGQVILEANRVDWSDSQKYDDGYYPMIALNGDSQVMEIHQSQSELRLWYRTGRLSKVSIGGTVAPEPIEESELLVAE